MDTGLNDSNAEILSLMLSRLYNRGILSDDDDKKLNLIRQRQKGRLKYTKIAIFDMLLEKDLVAASKIFLEIRSVKVENEESQKPITMIKNPMQIFTVIKNVLGFLNLSDVKNCRQINKNWNAVAGPMLKKRSKIVFAIDEKANAINCIRSPAKYFEIFAAPSVVRSFDSFQFESTIKYHPSDLINFFEHQKKNIKELTFCGVYLINENLQVLSHYDIGDWLVDLPLTKFHVYGGGLALSLDKLQSVSDIELSAGLVKVPTGCRVSPISFVIGDLLWQLENGTNDIDEIRLNDFIDFHNAKIIKLKLYDGHINVIFDISDCVDVKTLKLFYEVSVTNWNRAKATVDFLAMTGIPFLEKTEMKINKFRFSDGLIDLFCLPWSIEELYLPGHQTSTDVLCSAPIKLPNLRKLSCKNTLGDAELFTHFTNCTNLVDIHVTGAGDNVELDIACIPKSVKRIKLKAIKIVDSDLCGREIDTLVLTRCSLFNAAQILKTIKAKVLLLYWDVNFESNDSVLRLLKDLKNLVLYMGPFKWDDAPGGELNPNYKTSKLSTYVDKKSDYYVFENGFGKGIDERFFDTMYYF